MRRNEDVGEILSAAKSRSFLTEYESKRIMALYGLTITNERLVRTESQAAEAAEEIGYPVVLKIVSPDIIHKSEAGGVRLNIKSDTQLRTSYDEILKKARKYCQEADIWGVLVQEMLSDGIEVIVGMKRDPTFGPAILFGLGGIFTEVLKDVSLRVTPLNSHDALEMIEDIRGYPLLRGYRDRKPADIESIIDIILKIAQLSQDFSSILEIDLNPILVKEKSKGAIIADARLILGKGSRQRVGSFC